jgi:hypothetical protein
MVLTLLPTTAFAEGEIPDSTNVTVTFDGLEQFMSFRKQPWRSWHIFSRKSWI